VAAGDRLLVFRDPGSGSPPATCAVPAQRVRWAPARELLVLAAGEGADRFLERVDPQDCGTSRVGAVPDPSGAWWFRDGTEILALRLRADRRPIGLFVELSIVRVSGSRARTVYRTTLRYPTRDPDFDPSAGWLAAGLRPLHETLLLPSYRDPPALAPYLLLTSLDPVTEETQELGRLLETSMDPAFSWSPEGRRLAFRDRDGFLRIRAPAGDDGGVRTETRGLYPAWHPRRDLIFFGGRLVAADGRVVRTLPGVGPDTAALWSPDGRHLAVLSAEGVTVFRDLVPEGGESSLPGTELRGRLRRLRLLKDLRAEGLIDAAEFGARRERLLESGGGDR